MIRKIADILQEKERTYSFEFFPPKTDKGREKLYQVVAAFAGFEPDWFAVTYGAGGSTRGQTMDLVDGFQKRFDVPVMHHFTCVGHSRAELEAAIKEMKKRNVPNILALHGDPPQDGESWQPAPDSLTYCYQLVEFIRAYNGFFSIGVAGFPEGHIDCPDKETDSRYLKMKIEAGGEFVITQLFFDNKDYFEYLERVRKIGVTVRIIPGILPITNYQQLLRFCNTRGGMVAPQVLQNRSSC